MQHNLLSFMQTLNFSGEMQGCKGPQLGHVLLFILPGKLTSYLTDLPLYVLRRQPQRRSGLATVPSVGAVP